MRRKAKCTIKNIGCYGRVVKEKISFYFRSIFVLWGKNVFRFMFREEWVGEIVVCGEVSLFGQKANFFLVGVYLGEFCFFFVGVGKDIRGEKKVRPGACESGFCRDLWGME